MTLTEIVGGDPLTFAMTAAGIGLLVPATGVAFAQVRDAWRNRPGPWDYAGCCGCGESVVRVFTVGTLDGVEQVSEVYCRGCFETSEILLTLDHVVLDEDLVKVSWQFAARVFDRALWQRKAGAR